MPTRSGGAEMGEMLYQLMCRFQFTVEVMHKRLCRTYIMFQRTSIIRLTDCTVYDGVEGGSHSC